MPSPRPAAPATAYRPFDREGASARPLRGATAAANDPEPGEAGLLRHQTRAALQRILSLIEGQSCLLDSARGQRLVEDLRRRVMLTAAVSDAMFGLTAPPTIFPLRLVSLCENVVALLEDPGQDIRVEMSVTVQCPAPLRQTVLRVAHELISNAVRHAMHARAAGRIEVRLQARDGGLQLVVADDGWGCDGAASAGEGLPLARRLARAQQGTLNLERRADRTVATLDLPWPGLALAEG